MERGGERRREEEEQLATEKRFEEERRRRKEEEKKRRKTPRNAKMNGKKRFSAVSLRMAGMGIYMKPREGCRGGQGTLSV